MRRVLIAVALLLSLQVGTAFADPPTVAPGPPVAVVPASARSPWLVGGRPICLEDGYRYEPRVRDFRHTPPSMQLPGNAAGQRETLPVLPPYRGGYFRLFQGR